MGFEDLGFVKLCVLVSMYVLKSIIMACFEYKFQSIKEIRTTELILQRHKTYYNILIKGFLLSHFSTWTLIVGKKL